MKITNAIKNEAVLRVRSLHATIVAEGKSKEAAKPMTGKVYSDTILVLLVATPVLFAPKTYMDAHASSVRISELAEVLDYLSTQATGHSYNGLFGPAVVTEDVLAPSATLATDISTLLNLPLG